MRKLRRLSAEELAPYVWEVEQQSGRVTSERLAPPAIDWPALFGNDHPVEVEVGMGKGLFLLTAAQAQPNVNFFGIEIVRKYQLYAASRLAVRKLTNARTTCADAKLLLAGSIPSMSVAAVRVYFPDPWWKKRHWKRRLFTPDFAASAARVLQMNGLLHIATDVEEYYGVMAAMVRAMPAFRELPPPEVPAPTHAMDYLTNFERKARLKGTPIWRAAFERSTGPITTPAEPIL